MMTPQPGEFWVADVPFAQGRDSKKRPVLVLWLEGQTAVVAAVTSARPRCATDVPLVEWPSEGLRLASTLRLSCLDCFEHSLLLKRLGHIGSQDAERVRAIWQQHVQPQF